MSNSEFRLGIKFQYLFSNSLINKNWQNYKRLVFKRLLRKVYKKEYYCFNSSTTIIHSRNTSEYQCKNKKRCNLFRKKAGARSPRTLPSDVWQLELYFHFPLVQNHHLREEFF